MFFHHLPRALARQRARAQTLAWPMRDMNGKRSAPPPPSSRPLRLCRCPLWQRRYGGDDGEPLHVATTTPNEVWLFCGTRLRRKEVEREGRGTTGSYCQPEQNREALTLFYRGRERTRRKASRFFSSPSSPLAPNPNRRIRRRAPMDPPLPEPSFMHLQPPPPYPPFVGSLAPTIGRRSSSFVPGDVSRSRASHFAARGTVPDPYSNYTPQPPPPGTRAGHFLPRRTFPDLGANYTQQPPPPGYEHHRRCF